MPAWSIDKDWRGHVEETKKHQEAIQAALPLTSTQLALIGNEVGDRLPHAGCTRG